MKYNIILILITIFLYNCEKNEMPDISGSGKGYILVTTPTFVSPTSYLQVVESMDSTAVGNSNALEYMSAGMFKYNNMFFSANYSDNFIVRFLVNESGQLQEDVKIDLGGKPGRIWFKDGHTAFTYENTSFKVKIFDPTEMIIKETIDLSMVKRKDVPFLELYDIIERDGKVFIPLNLSLQWHSTALDSVHIAVVDLETKKLEKIIKSGKSQTAGAGILTRTCMAIDENNDLYFTTHLSTGGGGSSKPSGLMRIKSGSTDFDTTYFWDLTEATGGHRAEAFHYTGNGKAFITVGYPELINPDNAMSSILDPVYKWWHIDITNKTAAQLPMPATKGFNANWVMAYKDNYLIPIGNNDETSIYEYSISGDKVIRKITTNGLPISLHKID